MNTFLKYGAVAALVAYSPSLAAAITATAASTLFESTPFILAGVLLHALSPRAAARIGALLDCGCSQGASARSLPAALAAALTFGPAIAAARLIGGHLSARFFQPAPSCAAQAPGALGSLAAVLPFALTGAALATATPVASLAHLHPVAAAAVAALGTMISSPCALGAFGFASALRGVSWSAAIAVLCVSGIFDLRAIWRRRDTSGGHDFLAYVLLALSCALVANRQGAELVHPHFTVALWACALFAAGCAFRYRSEIASRARIAPLLMFAGAIASAPPPPYAATQTTLADAFAGEALNIDGRVERDAQHHIALVRFAIMCCRADAQPVAVRLLHPAATLQSGSWAHAEGTLTMNGDALALDARTIRAIAAPPDPFIYR